jgi:hypothetical protein
VEGRELFVVRGVLLCSKKVVKGVSGERKKFRREGLRGSRGLVKEKWESWKSLGKKVKGRGV